MGANRIQLAHPTPQGAVTHAFGQFDALRRADDGGLLGALADGDVQRVITLGQIGGKHQQGGEHEIAIDVMGHAVVRSEFDPSGVHITVLQGDGRLRHVEGAAVDLHRAFPADDVQYGRGHDAGIAVMLDGCDGLRDRLIVGSVDAKRLEHRHQNIVFDFVVVVAHADIAGGDTHQFCQTDERTGKTRCVFGLFCHIKQCKPPYDAPRADTPAPSPAHGRIADASNHPIRTFRPQCSRHAWRAPWTADIRGRATRGRDASIRPAPPLRTDRRRVCPASSRTCSD